MSDDEPIKNFKGFAQRNTPRNSPATNSALRLRHQAIAFVGSTSKTPFDLDNEPSRSEKVVAVAVDESEEEESDEDREEQDSDFDDTNLQINILTDNYDGMTENAEIDADKKNMHDMTEQMSGIEMSVQHQSTQPASQGPQTFMFDSFGDSRLDEDFSSYGRKATKRAPSPAASDSSEEVVVFSGRNAKANGVRAVNGPSILQSRGRDSRSLGQKIADNTARETSSTAPTPPPHATSAIPLRPSAASPSNHARPQQRSNGTATPEIRSTPSGNSRPMEAMGWAASMSKADQQVNPNAQWAPAPSVPYWKKGKGKGQPRPDLDPAPVQVKAFDDSPVRQARVSFEAPQVDGRDEDSHFFYNTSNGVADGNIDVAIGLKIHDLAKCCFRQRVHDAEQSRGHVSKKPEVHQRTLSNLASAAMLRSELSSEHAELASRVTLKEARRIRNASQDIAAGKFTKKFKGPYQISYAEVDTTAMDVDDSTGVQEPHTEPTDAYHSDDNANGKQPIDSLQADWNATLRDMGKGRQSTRRGGKRGRKKDNRRLRQPVLSEDDDFAGEAAYDDYMANLAAQMDGNGDDGLVDLDTTNGLTMAIGGPSLVVDGREIGEDEVLDIKEKEQVREVGYAEGMMDDDEWSSTSSGASEIGRDLSGISDMDSSDLEDELDYTEKQQWEDEVDLRRRRQERMSDEKFARLLDKQQQLGISADELIIEDGDFDDSSDGVGDVAAARNGITPFIMRGLSANTGARRSNRYRKDNFPDATALADSVEQYGENGFDIMDFERPSLRPTKKGRKGQLPPELEALSDEELKENMTYAWDNDRAKKRLKKAERDELRAMGLLGSGGKKGKADLKDRYAFGMSSRQIHDELRIFLADDGQRSRPFPPMDKRDRKDLHDLASALNLTSKSVGSGKNRFPVLNKTSRTFEYDPEVFDRIVGASRNGYLDREKRYGKRLAKGSKSSGKSPRVLGGAAAATIRNGEVVGAGAPEMSKENFGHKMMEKMGWSKGMALGAAGEGRLLPVEQVMRAGRNGLGGY